MCGDTTVSVGILCSVTQTNRLARLERGGRRPEPIVELVLEPALKLRSSERPKPEPLRCRLEPARSKPEPPELELLLGT